MSFSVLQWNVWYKELNQNIASFLKMQSPDIICLQELTIEEGDNGHAPDYIAEQLGYECYYQEIDLGTDKITLANGIFSRFPIVDTRTVWINAPSGSAGYDDEPRAFIEATVKIGDRNVTIGTTHMSYTHGFEITPRKSQETDTLIDEITKHSENFILAGDMNAISGSYTIKKLENYLENASPECQHPTWTTKPFSYEGFEETELRWRLDYIFATSDMRVSSTKILDTEYSDHLPIMSWFE